MYNTKLHSQYPIYNDVTNMASQHMAIMFRRRQKTIESRKEKFYKRGVIDTNRLHKYKTHDDIFKRKVLKPDGKSYGICIFMDMSGSMEHISAYCLDQVILLSKFARIARIPFEVYGFKNTSPNLYVGRRVIAKNVSQGDLLLNILSSRLDKRRFEEACRILWFSYRGAISTNSFSHQGTPLNGAIIRSIDVINKFRRNNSLQVVIPIFLTDGNGGDSVFNIKKPAKSSGRLVLKFRNKSYSFTGYDLRTEPHTVASLEIFRELTGIEPHRFHIDDSYYHEELGTWLNVEGNVSKLLNDNTKLWRKTMIINPKVFSNFTEGDSLTTYSNIPKLKFLSKEILDLIIDEK